MDGEKAEATSYRDPILLHIVGTSMDGGAVLRPTPLAATAEYLLASLDHRRALNLLLRARVAALVTRGVRVAAQLYECAECSQPDCNWRGVCDGESCPACGGHVVAVAAGVGGPEHG